MSTLEQLPALALVPDRAPAESYQDDPLMQRIAQAEQEEGLLKALYVSGDLYMAMRQRADAGGTVERGLVEALGVRHIQIIERLRQHQPAA